MSIRLYKAYTPDFIEPFGYWRPESTLKKDRKSSNGRLKIMLIVDIVVVDIKEALPAN
jgi:hypothetical protein